MYDDSNVFSKILRAEISAKKIYENEVALAFYDIAPVCRVHAIVIPKARCRNFLEFTNMSSPQDVNLFFDAVAKVTEILQVAETGFRLVSNCGPDSGQEVDHFHVHVLAGEKVPGVLGRK